MSSAWMKIIDLHNKETYGDHLWIPFRWTGDQTFIHDRYTYVHFAIFFYIVKSSIHIRLGLCEALCLASFASCSRRGRTGERCTISRAGTAKSLSTTIWLSLPPQNEQQGGRPSVNTVGTIRCWKWMWIISKTYIGNLHLHPAATGASSGFCGCYTAIAIRTGFVGATCHWYDSFRWIYMAVPISGKVSGNKIAIDYDWRR